MINIGAIMKDKVRKEGDGFTQDQLDLCMVKENYDGDDKAYLSLIKAYRHCQPDHFAQFVEYFKENGLDLNAKSANGETALETISGHARSEEYVEILKTA